MPRGGIVVALAVLGCGPVARAAEPPSAPPAPPAQAPLVAQKAAPEESPLLGPVEREQIEAAVPEWVAAEVASNPDAATAKRLATVEPGADVTIYLGTWCSDSRREVSRLWRALDEAGTDPPFAIHYVGVDRAKREPAALLAGADLRFVPTIIVRRGGSEVGRIVEEAPHGIEHDLLSLLTGEAHGLISGRDDLAGEPASGSPGRF